MESMAQVLEEMKDIYRRLGGAEPLLVPGAEPPFPPGVDPAALVTAEVEAVRSLAAAAGAMGPVPGATWTPAPAHPGLWPAPMAWTPPADAWIAGNELVMALGISGCAAGEIRVGVSPGCVDVTGVRPASPGEPRTWLGSERPIGPFMRRLPLPADADPTSARARLRDGVLEIRVRLGAQPTTTSRREVHIEG